MTIANTLWQCDMRLLPGDIPVAGWDTRRKDREEESNTFHVNSSYISVRDWLTVQFQRVALVYRPFAIGLIEPLDAALRPMPVNDAVKNANYMK